MTMVTSKEMLKGSIVSASVGPKNAVEICTESVLCHEYSDLRRHHVAHNYLSSSPLYHKNHNAN